MIHYHVLERRLSGVTMQGAVYSESIVGIVDTAEQAEELRQQRHTKRRTPLENIRIEERDR